MPEQQEKLNITEADTEIEMANKLDDELGELGQSWLKRITEIRLAAQKNQRKEMETSHGNNFDVPSDTELFVEHIKEFIPKQDLFKGDEELFKTIHSVTDAKPHKKLSTELPAITANKSIVSWTWGHRVMAASILIIALVLVYVVTRISSSPYGAVATTTQIQTPIEAKEIVEEPEFIPETEEPISLKAAQNLYLKGQYDQAYSAYQKLSKLLPKNDSLNTTREYLTLQMGSCLLENSKYELAEKLLNDSAKSPSAIIKIASNYLHGIIDLQNNRYFQAREHAYKAIGLLDAASFDSQWISSMSRNCNIMIAEALTRQLLRNSDGDKNLPENLWAHQSKDAFIDIDEAHLANVLKKSSETFKDSVLGPKITKSPSKENQQWSITCYKASLTDVLNRFSANVSLDLIWKQEQKQITNKTVNLHLLDASPKQVIETVAGSAGLMPVFTESNSVQILDPAEYSQLSDNIELLRNESVALWQRFLFNNPNDRYLANVHYILGILKTQNQPNEAIAEYKLLANSFERSELAPYALLRSSEIKKSLNDYSGAKSDLIQLIEQYHNSDVINDGYFSLADSQNKAGAYEDAAKMYLKVFYLSSSDESKATAALAAGENFYKLKNYEQAENWFKEYLKHGKNDTPENLSYTYYQLGKARLDSNKPKEACQAFLTALDGQLSSEVRAKVILELAKSYKEQQDYISAIEVLEKSQFSQFSQQKTIEILIMKSASLREIGLVDKAIATLGDRADYILNPELKTKILFELCKCDIAKGQLNTAHKKLSRLLAHSPAGDLANEIALCLCQVSFDLDLYEQTAKSCLRLLANSPDKIIKQKTTKLLAQSYKKQNDYDKATLALLGQWKQGEEYETN